MSEINIRVVVTGTDWMGSGIGSVESALEQLFREAKQEIILTAYSISTRADLLFDWMRTALDRGVKISLIINRLDDQPYEVTTLLYQLADTYNHLQLYSFLSADHADLHAKVIVVDRQIALIGSSNLYRRGLQSNHEMAVLFNGTAAASAASGLDQLLKSQDVARVPTPENHNLR